MISEPLKAQIGDLLARDSGVPRDFELVPCGAGGNNRVFLIVAGTRKLVAKWYFSHASDKRDRLGTEFGFLTYANRVGITCVPTPISCDPAQHLALYEHIEGARISVDQVTLREVDEAADFFLALNRLDARPQAASLPIASEACFTINDHLTMVDGRIERLLNIAPENAVDREAGAFVMKLRVRWELLKSAIAGMAPKRGIKVDMRLPDDQRCISPSDFGFHNSLRRPSGDICFLDFEYAGWDDPAKMAGDFFSHPAISVDHRFRDHFLANAMSFYARPQTLIARAELLFPVFQTKWCCIILNDFLTDSARRRRFADPAFDELERKRIQLAKAAALFESIHIE
jgi:hypothetical protein